MRGTGATDGTVAAAGPASRTPTVPGGTVRAVNRLTARWAAALPAAPRGTVLSAAAVWPLLAFLAEGAAGPARAELEDAVGMPADRAAEAARGLLGALGRIRGSSAAIGLWARPGLPLRERWVAGLPGAAADDDAGHFPGVSDSPLAVGRAAQAGTARFTRDGFEAASVTAFVGIAGGAAEPRPRYRVRRVELDVDRPFGFLAVHRTSRLVLSAGWVADPVEYAYEPRSDEDRGEDGDEDEEWDR
ncbi:hypothetical protein ABZ618_12455 [Streptomyces roseolus]|uniref:hypothetical protein n=1 Tax=Streptomyces roseolus TaxID=67358 RepID=UPI0034068986